MIVTLNNFSEVLNVIKLEDMPGVDTETTGLKVYQNDKLFSIIVSTASEEYYFNFNDVPDHLGGVCPHILPRDFIGSLVSILVQRKKLFMANAKFDMAMLQKEVPFTIAWPEIHDVLVVDRLINSDQMKINLASVAKKYGLEKLDVVEEYIKEHHLWAWEVVPHRKKRDKLKFFYLVPFQLMADYACRDANITRQIGFNQLPLMDQIFGINRGVKSPYQIEMETTDALFRMEQTGVNLDEIYISDQGTRHSIRVEQLGRKFHDETRNVFIDSAKTLAPLFITAGFTPPRTDKDNDSITDDWLETLDHPLSKLVQEIRGNSKAAGFYKAYQWYKGSDGLLHANVNQAGTRTGRFSMSNPNLQQMPDDEVRRSFVAPKSWDLVSLDFDQQEYRMMLDYAKQFDLIEQVKGGLDVHTATANLTGVSRTEAKTLNFMLLYGGGVVKLALALFKVTTTEPILWAMWKRHNGWKLEAEDKKWLEFCTPALESVNLPELYKAQDLRKLYFSKLPEVEKLINDCKSAAKDRGFIYTWTGRRIYFKKRFSYKAPNGLIQGGASDVCKVSIIGIDKLLRKYESKLLASIHDELILKIHPYETSLIREISSIMEKAYPSEYLPLTVGVHIGKNLFDMEKYET